MRLSELQQKDVVNILDGKKVGRIIDAEIDEQGNIKRLIVEEKMKLRSFLGSGGEVSINFLNIKKIGSDVILVELWYNTNEMRKNNGQKNFYNWNYLFIYRSSI